MPVLFVDCDDTLILWQYKEAITPLFDEGKHVADQVIYTLPNEGEKFKINELLIFSIVSFLTSHFDWELVIWSGGGREYAERWARLLFPNQSLVALEKNITFPWFEDICIDDQELKVKARLYTPDEFIAGIA